MAAVIKACIYRIDVCDEFYIGSTTDFEKRVTYHNDRLNKEGQQALYKAIRANNGKYEMSKLYDFECYTPNEIKISERAAYDKYKPTLNMIKPYITEEERRLYHNEATKKFNQENKEIIKERRRLFYQKNKERISAERKERMKHNKPKPKTEEQREKARLYREKNKERATLQRKERYNNNKEKVAEQQRLYRAANKEKVAQQRRDRYLRTGK
tara:strand:+ start:718 stop:1353 length:636 start_codon:yes stop_codon:yes gene_type:complete